MEIILLVLTLSVDAFVASIAYGNNEIKIPLSSILIINLVCSLFLGLSVFLGSSIKKFLPDNLATLLSFSILILLGIYYLLESFVKSYLRNKTKDKNLKFKVFNIWIIVNVYIDETQADLDKSKNLDYKEALYLGAALSLDSLAVGFGGSLGNINCLSLVSLSFIFGMFSIYSELLLGKK